MKFFKKKFELNFFTLNQEKSRSSVLFYVILPSSALCALKLSLLGKFLALPFFKKVAKIPNTN